MTGVVLGFAALVLVGTILLSLPMARVPSQPLSLLNSLFTATSAVCLVGLVVVNTGTYWSTFGQIVILGLVQLGGIGIMTATMLILVILRRSVSLQDRFELYELSKAGGLRSVTGLIWLTVLVTVGAELLGTLALWFRFRQVYGDEDGWWPAAFHSVSAFNNAGFDLFESFSSLTPFSRDPVLLAVVSLLIIAGGISVLVLIDLAMKRSWRLLTPNSKMLLTASGFLLAIGFGGIMLFEFNNPNTLGNMTMADKATNSLFQSVTARTAGFNSISVSGMNDATLFLTMALMYIGGATGSTAGGIKVGTFAVLVLAAWASIHGYQHASAFGRRFSHRLVYRALTVAVLSGGVIFIGTLILTLTEDLAFRHLLFEVVSAFGTVGLTTGITPDLSIVGKGTIIVIMFIGRLGPLSLAYALAQRARQRRYALPEKDVAIG
ncbi:MAG: potassium transporter TrkG [Dehalococcoidia bacterium]|nr:potassium transporter TrkG [Dehalococcoidia bacterium]